MTDAAAFAGRHVVLVGLMGTGKTTVGELLAARLGRTLVDSDAVIEARTGRTVREIFAAEGEPAFRALETAALTEALASPEPTVIAAAGGAVIAARNRRAISESGAFVAWLDADVDVLSDRATRGTHRPLLDGDAAATLREMAVDRAPLYREVDTLRIDTTHRSPADVVDAIFNGAMEP